MRPYKYFAPVEVDEVLEQLTRAEEETVLLGGGTSAVLMMKQELIVPDVVIALGRVAALRGVATTPDGGLRLGATCTLTELETSPAVATCYPVLASTAHGIGNIRVRNVATVGGNLVHGDPAQDLPPVLMALGATVILERRQLRRAVPLDEFYTGYMETVVEPDELLTAVELPPPPLGHHANYIKFTPRSHDDFATVGVACALVVANGCCQSVALVLGGVGATPMRMHAAEEILAGEPLTTRRIAEAAQLVEASVEPWDDLRGSASYKRAMARVWTERILLALGRQAGLAP